MQCLFLFRDSSGRLPTAQELRARGFRVSKAVLNQEPMPEAEETGGPGRALAAEPRAVYGETRRDTGPKTAGS